MGPEGCLCLAVVSAAERVRHDGRTDVSGVGGCGGAGRGGGLRYRSV